MAVVLGGKMPSFLSSEMKLIGGRLGGLPSAMLDGALGEWMWPRSRERK